MTRPTLPALWWRFGAVLGVQPPIEKLADARRWLAQSMRVLVAELRLDAKRQDPRTLRLLSRALDELEVMVSADDEEVN